MAFELIKKSKCLKFLKKLCAPLWPDSYHFKFFPFDPKNPKCVFLSIEKHRAGEGAKFKV